MNTSLTMIAVGLVVAIIFIIIRKIQSNAETKELEIELDLDNKIMANAEPEEYRCCMCSKKFNDGGTFKRYNGKWYCLDCYFKKREADKLLDLEQITGLSTDTLQEMENVSRIAGVSFDGLTDTITKWVSGCERIKAGEK